MTTPFINSLRSLVCLGKYTASNSFNKEIAINSVDMARALCVWRRHPSFYDVRSYHIKVRMGQAMPSFFDYLILFFKTLSTSSVKLNSMRALYINHYTYFGDASGIYWLICGASSLSWNALSVVGSHLGSDDSQASALSRDLSVSYNDLESFETNYPL